MNAKMQLTNVHITVRLNGHDTSYKTAVPYSMMNLPETARNMAMEYWGKVQAWNAIHCDNLCIE